MTSHEIDKPDIPEVSVQTGWSYRPRIDVTELTDEFRIVTDMPGSTPEDIHLDCKDRILTIRGTVQARQHRETEYLVHEFGIGDFDREIALPNEVDPDKICAEYEHGVLTIHLPKSEEAKPRRIPVRAG